MMGNKERSLVITFETRKHHCNHIHVLPFALWSKFSQVNIVNHERIPAETMYIYQCMYIFALFSN